MSETPNPAIHPQTRMGHVHLRVSDLDRALAFYHGVLGFEVTQHLGNAAAFLSAGGYHHHIGLNTWESLGGSPPPPGTTGLYHLAVLYPTRAALGDALRRLIAAKIPLDGVELYWDRPQEQWPKDANGNLAMFTRALDLQSLLATKEA